MRHASPVECSGAPATGTRTPSPWSAGLTGRVDLAPPVDGCRLDPDVFDTVPR